MDWFDLLSVQGTLNSLLQHHSSKASILWCSAFFTVQLSHPYLTTGKTTALTRQTFVGKVMSLLFNMLSRLVITFLLRGKPLTNLDSIFESRDIKSPQSYGFSSSHIQIWELDHKEGWAPKNWYFWTVVLEKTPESPLDCKEIKPVIPKGNQPWMFIGWAVAEAEAPILWPPDAKSQLIGKDPDAEEDWGQEEKGMTEDG